MSRKKTTVTPPAAELTAPAAPTERLYTQTQVDALVQAAVTASRQRPQRKICILGTTPSRSLAPFNDPTWEIWTIGPGGKDANRWDILFELHGKDTWPMGFQRRMSELDALRLQAGPGNLPPGASEHIEALAKLAADGKSTGNLAEAFDTYVGDLSKVQPVEREVAPGHKVTKAVCTMEHMPGWASNEVYPKDRIIKRWGRMWLSSSISWCIALAIELGVTDLGIFGIDLESGEEYEAQFEGARFFLDVARLGFGIRIYMPEDCGLLRDPNPYPDRWETSEALYVQSKIRFLESQISPRQAEYAKLGAEINNGEGQISQMRWALEQKLGDPTVIQGRIDDLMKAVQERNQSYARLAAEINRIEGEMDMGRHWLRMFVHKGVAKPHRITA